MTFSLDKNMMAAFSFILVLFSISVPLIDGQIVEECVDISPDQLESRLLMLNNLHSFSDNVPDSLLYPETAIPDDLQLIINESKRHGIGLPTRLPHGRHAGKNARSQCPWYYQPIGTPSVDPNRYPSVLLEAVLRNQDCIDERGNTIANMVCEFITYPYIVLRKIACRNGVFQYRAEQMTLKVGATCSIVRR